MQIFPSTCDSVKLGLIVSDDESFYFHANASLRVYPSHLLFPARDALFRRIEIEKISSRRREEEGEVHGLCRARDSFILARECPVGRVSRFN